MELNYYLPSPPLQPLLTVFGDVGTRGLPAIEKIPAMLPNLHIRLAGRSIYQFADGTAIESPPVALLGASAGAFTLWMSADFEMLFAGMLPLGWQAFVPFAADELTDSIVDASLIWPASAIDRLLAGCQAAPRAAARLAILEAFLLERRLEARPGSRGHLPTIDRWIEHSADLSIDALGGDLGVSNRQMRRLTLFHHGLSPKELAMKYRALRSASALSIHGASSLDQAGLLYADQSHLIRDFRRFVGWTPRAFVTKERNLAAATLSGRWKAGARRPLALLG